VLSASHIIVASGTYPFHPAEIPFDGKRVHDSDTILELDRLPKSLCIIGAGVIGCEYATIFAAMGTKFYLVNQSRDILGFVDREISAALIDQMKADGIDVRLGASLESVRRPADDEAIIVVGLGDGTELSVDMFLFAAGRSGCTDNFGLEAAGIA